MNKVEKGQSTAERLSRFAGDALRLSDGFPSTKAGKHVADQLIRSATSPGANYAEARGAHSRKEFIYRLSLSLKELRESLHWIRVASSAGWPEGNIDPLLQEGLELVRILAASKATAQKRTPRE